MLNTLRDAVHSDNVAAGWWTDIHTGESTLTTRNRPEMLMLIVSELSEACEAHLSNAKDDKLPELWGFDVELADAAIRILDLAGAEGIDLELPDPTKLRFFCEKTADLMAVVNQVSRAMEGVRKGDVQKYHDGIRTAFNFILTLAADSDFNLFDVIEQKREFNRNRADHKIENRLKADGKKF